MSLESFEQASRDFDAAKARMTAVRTADDDLAVDFLSTLPPLEYARMRRTEAARLGVTVGALDRVVAARRRQIAGAVASLTGKCLRNFQPAANAVNGQQVLSLLVATLERYVVLPPHGAVAVALWIVCAHALDLFAVNPRLALLSPEKRCGKTTLLELLDALTPRALLVSNVTPAALFRVIEATRPTLLIDELDSFKDADEELRGILNSGHRRAAAFVLRCVGDTHEPKPFSTWAPMCYAMIGEPPATLRDRSIIVPMRRRAPNERVVKLRWSGRAGDALRTSLNMLAEAIVRFIKDNAEKLRQAEPDIPPGLHDRAADNWSGLLAIADVVGGEWPERARAAAVALSNNDVETESVRIQLLNDVRAAFIECNKDRVSSQELCCKLVSMEERPWATWKYGRGITPNQLARMLKPFEIRSRDIWVKEHGVKGCVKGYVLEDFKEAFCRYLSPRESASSSPGEGGQARERETPLPERRSYSF